MDESHQPAQTRPIPDGIPSMYVPSQEKDACGIGFVANINGIPSHDTVRDALSMLERMQHRGACGADPLSGDGAGILVDLPDAFFREVLPFNLPEQGQYAVGFGFFPREDASYATCLEILERKAKALGMNLLGIREIPVSNTRVGESVKETEPRMAQVFVAPDDPSWKGIQFERTLYLLRKASLASIRHELHIGLDQCYFASFSHKKIVYKGQLSTFQLAAYFPDLAHPLFQSRMAMIHSRYSTNTFPKWRLAQPFRFIAHNGEINTIEGNINHMEAREASLISSVFSQEEMDILTPICDAEGSDSANLDSIIELLFLEGRSLPHVMMMLIPEAWENNPDMPEAIKGFYQYHATLMEPWDGPAAVCFTDGDQVGCTLDRNGLRPLRYLLTHDNRIVVSSEAGVVDVAPEKIMYKGRLQPGKMLLVDFAEKRVLMDEEIKKKISGQKPYATWVSGQGIYLSEIKKTPAAPPKHSLSLTARLRLFGFTKEDFKVILAPMVREGREPIGSMGSDTPLGIMSRHSQHLSNYFKQLFAQVSNPPIDPIRERLVLSLKTQLGNWPNILQDTPNHGRKIFLESPVLTPNEMAALRQDIPDEFSPQTLKIGFSIEEGLQEGIRQLCEKAASLVQSGSRILILSDSNLASGMPPISTLMACGAVHHFLLKKGIRDETSLVIEGGDICEVHHFATLLGFGANAIYPYLIYESLRELRAKNFLQLSSFSYEKMEANYIKAIEKGLLKVFSKMGISTLQSYRGAQIFEVLGLHTEVVSACFDGAVSRIGGLGFKGIEREIMARFQIASSENEESFVELPAGGVYQWKLDGEYHLFNPETIHLLQYATQRNDYSLYKKYAAKINDHTQGMVSLRGMLDFVKKREPIPLEEVEPATEIFKRFATGAMSFGSISYEAHTTLAIAMNRIGGKSNSGEGGEDERRYEKKANGDWERSAIKQVASGRFGVTSYYLSQAEELQIKMAQGAKPGEGGQLPGHKVDDWIGRVRHATPGVGLISPPPHHDIYSIEDLGQLIFDLKNANRDARISVKLVSKAGIGTIAAGVAKGHADVILVSGSDGGTGASPISSVKHAGLPWELGLAETNQTLLKNGLRNRVVLQVDGQLRTGRDLAIAALLGAEEFGVATAALVVQGCIMMRKCHLNTCPVGIATQDPELRKLFAGTPEELIHFFTFLVEDLREIMASLGFRTVNEMVGQSDFLAQRENPPHWKLASMNLQALLHKEAVKPGDGRYSQVPQDHGIDDVLDWQLVKVARAIFENGGRARAQFSIKNTDRSVGALLSHEISKRFKGKGLAPKSLQFHFQGSAGQSFGAFAAPGIYFLLEGEANDYVGKGLSGATLVIRPPKKATFPASQNMIIGNVAFYGATSGTAFINGLAGERFCVRNSGATTVVEGIGDHGCEYMTGGRVAVLGPVGKNFAAGMSGGVAYVLDQKGTFPESCNREMVLLEPLLPEDEHILKTLIEEHYRLTGSQRAQEILFSWRSFLSRFIKVMPKEYKAALEKKEPSYKEAI